MVRPIRLTAYRMLGAYFDLASKMGRLASVGM